jgi:hypothetical protein
MAARKSLVWKKPVGIKTDFKPTVPHAEEARESLKTPFAKRSLALLAINILLIVFILLINNNLPPEVPLYYGLARGSDQLANANLLMIPSLISMSVVIINFLVSNITTDTFLRTTLISASIAVTFFSAITTLKIIFLVGSF